MWTFPGEVSRDRGAGQGHSGAIHECPQLHRSVLPCRSNVGGIDLNQARMRCVIEAVIALSPLSDGFTASELANQVRALGKQWASEYSARHAAYDLKKLRGKNIVGGS